ncbi:MAG: Plexin repeat family protein [Berkelbacteria bacterium GW2011_GWE1_39_12]|uniref:Plexin repeat family protein n=1 Tax=Berkelbacteria bacterium GW2011_GWE1_39_12 TaxID=1618337 RepID=A0A0G4B355_9BACT|nr:MAG: Plexin repeat family protein [Berkelbacteria bacterium GW2011_GWE1_39_12]
MKYKFSEEKETKKTTEQETSSKYKSSAGKSSDKYKTPVKDSKKENAGQPAQDVKNIKPVVIPQQKSERSFSDGNTQPENQSGGGGTSSAGISGSGTGSTGTGSGVDTKETQPGNKPTVSYPGEEQTDQGQEESQGENQTGKKEEKKEDKDKDEKEAEDKKEQESDKEKPDTEKNEEKGEGEKTPEGEKPGPVEGKSDISPSLDENFQNKKVNIGASDAAKSKAKDELVKEGAEKVGEKAAQQGIQQGAKVLAKAALTATSEALEAALAAVVGFFGWPVLLICLAIFIVLMLIFIGLACSAQNGYFGKTYPTKATAGSTYVSEIKEINSAAAGGMAGVINAAGFHKFDYLNSEDKTYVNEGNADYRLLQALKYLSDRHLRIGTSHIISGYKDMPNDPESGAARDSQLTNNVSAHKDGLASDVAEIDFVYKSLEPNRDICSGANGTPPMNDVVYYSDGLPDNVSGADGAPTGRDFTTSGLFSDLSGSAQDLLNQLNQINIDSLSQNERNEVNDTTNNVGDLQNTLQQDSDRINQYTQNMDTVKPKIETFRTAVNNSSLTPEQKAEYNRQLDDLTKKLNTSLIQITGVGTVITNLQTKMDQITADLQSNIDNINSDIDRLNAQIDTINSALEQFTNLDSISQIGGLDSLNDYLGGINTGFDQVTGALTDNLNLDQFSNFAGLSDGLLGNIGGFGGFFGGDNEMLRLRCEGGLVSTGLPGQPAGKKAIPIKVTWQDSKPTVTHVSAESDESTSTDPRVFYSVYQPEARKKVHQVIAELLKFPYDKGNTSTYRVTQLITYSKERDVIPFSSILNALYGKTRPANYGLFAMPESWAQVHVAY